MNFAQIIHPISVEEFFNDYYEKKPLYIARNSATYYHTFLNLPEIDSYIQLKQTFSPNVKMAFEGKEVSPLLFCDNDNDVAPFKANPQKMLALFKQGYTIKYDKLHQTYPPLAQKISALENEIGIHIRTSLYITPEDSQGYGVHTDRHDVLALQLNGTKVWKVKFSQELLPSKYFTPIAVNWAEEGVQEIHLKAGDFFYCPRGLAHDVFTKEKNSTHFTIGFQPVYGYHLAEHLKEMLYHNVFFRKAIPNNFSDEKVKSDYLQQWRNNFAQLVEEMTLEELLNITKKEHLSSNLGFEKDKFLTAFYEPNESDEWMLNASISWQFSVTKVGCAVQLNEGIHDFPFLLKDFFDKLSARKKANLADLPSVLNTVQKMKIVKRLIKLQILIA